MRTDANQRNQKWKAEEGEESAQPHRLTSKQRRAMDRAKRTKKVGVRYYKLHNVKNKNKDRKAPAAATEEKSDGSCKEDEESWRALLQIAQCEKQEQG
ncbi:hypothetical protein F2P81_002502 [Scophthalmus maximus]|uniref:Uncharacterized protein n=1 Tax=Scophthalmus maximus TaxID=52904 RepID=A0A6A4TIY6_SCOMX|nr:hypothetical protein F2P81_002502 [Scophthalmus maximus]